MPPLILSANDSEYTNNVSLSDAPAVWLTGDRIRFINSESGRAITTTADVAAIRMDGADGVVVNEAGGIIRSAVMGGVQLVIQGSAGSDRVENSGTIIGRVALGEGSDTYLNLTGTSEFQTVVELGGGDDFYHIRATSSISLSSYVDGGEGTDRYVIESDGNVDGPSADNFEILDLRGNGFIESFSGLDTIVVDYRGAGRFFTGLRFFDTPDAEVQILALGGNTSLSIYDRSAIGGVTGSEYSDSLDLGNDTLVSGRIDFGAGDDYLVIRRSQFENPQQTLFGEEIDGGDGTDTLSIQLQGGDAFDAGNVVNFERMQVLAYQPSASALIIRNVDHVPELVISQFNTVPVRLELSDLSAGSLKLEGPGSLVITADSVVGLVFGLTPFPLDTAVSDDTRSLSIVNDGQILGEVRLYIGDDLLDSRAGTVGGHVFGYAGNDTILTDLGDNWLDGGAGADHLSGGAGNDMLIGGSAGDTLQGGAGLDTLQGGTGDDFLDGGADADQLSGQAGNDTYIVDHGSDTVVEGAGEGTRDVIYARTSYTMAAGVAVEVLSVISQGGGTAIDLTGNALFQELYGNTDANFLDGGAGADSMQGFGGNDTYIVDHSGDAVIEGAGEGTRDVIYARTSYTMAAGLDVEVLSVVSQSGGTAIDLTGNAFYQELYGNTDANFLDGGAGADSMQGFTGNDTYIVDHDGDAVIEGAGEGTRDVIYARTSYTMAAGLDVEVLSVISQSGGTAIDLTGNALFQELYGNTDANFLDGGAGADYLQGFTGNDNYIVDVQADTIVEGASEGTRDVVIARASYALAAGVGVEVMTTISGSATTAIDLTGNALAQEIYGNAGANVLNGGLGADYLQGFGGADSFAFTTALGSGNVDTVADFAAGTDKLALDDAIFAGIGTPGAFNAAAFVTGAAAADADDRIVYNAATGQLFYDADGNGAGAQVLFATLAGNPALAANDFAVI